VPPSRRNRASDAESRARPELGSGFNDQKQQECDDDDWDRTDHQHEIVSWAKLRWQEIVGHDCLLDPAQMPKHINERADDCNKGNSREDADRQQRVGRKQSAQLNAK
jgi:hypothetical protein